MRYYLSYDNKTIVATTELLIDYLPLSEEEYANAISGISPPPYYFDGTNWLTRPTFTHTNPVYLTEGEVFSLELPTDYTELIINKTPTTQTTISFNSPGTYEINIEPFPYMPVTVTFIVSADINREKERKIDQLDKDCNQYILKHYSYGRQNTFKAKYLQIVDELSFNSANYTQTEIDTMNQAKARILAVNSWIDSVLDYYYTTLNSIKNATTVADVQAIAWDFSQFDSTDPLVTIEEIRSLLLGILW